MAVAVSVTGRVQIITIDRPARRNAIDHETAVAITAALDSAEQSDAVGAVILTGAGDRSFSAGFDLTAERGPGSRNAFIPGRGFAGLCEYDFPKPLIAAINGSAFGGGFEMVLACHMAVMSSDARLCLPEIKIGGLAGAGGLIELPRKVPMPVALEMILTGEPIGAARAYELGLVNRVVDPGQVMAVALELATAIAEGPPVSVRVCLRATRQMAEVDRHAAWRLNADAVAEVTSTRDTAEGIAAFTEKRKPIWAGR